MEQPQIELSYWGIKGLGEFARLTLAYLQLPYTEHNPESGEAWAQTAGTLAQSGLHFPNLPFVKDGDLYFSESQTIPIYLCRRAGRNDLVGGDDLTAQTRISEIMGVLGDVRTELIKAMFGDYKTTVAEAVKDGSKIHRKLQFLAKFLGENDWFIGNNFTVLDIMAGYTFYIGGIVTRSATGTNAIEAFPTLQAHAQRLLEQPGIKEHVASDKWKRPFFPPTMIDWITEE